MQSATIIKLNPKRPAVPIENPENALLGRDWEGIGKGLARALQTRIDAEEAKHAKSQAACLAKIAKIFSKKSTLSEILTIAGGDIEKFTRGLDAVLTYYQAGTAVNTTLLLKQAARDSGIPEDYLRNKIKPLLELHNIMIKNHDTTFNWASLKQLKKGQSMLKKLRITYTLPTYYLHIDANQMMIARAKEPATWIGFAAAIATTYGLNVVNDTAIVSKAIEQFGYAPHLMLAGFASAAIKHGLNNISKPQALLLSSAYIPSLALFGESGYATGELATNMANAINQSLGGSHILTVLSLSASITLLLRAADALPSFARIADIIGHWATTGTYLHTPIKTKEPKSFNTDAVPQVTDLTKTLESLGVKGALEYPPMMGAVITRHMVKLPPGKLPAFKPSDLARSLGVDSVLIEENAGKGCIAIDTPNHKRETIFFESQLTRQEWLNAKQEMALPMIVGEWVDGSPFIFDLATAPHALIAGTSGGGKSALLNCMLLSLLQSNKPQIKLVLIDPKIIELSAYKNSASLMQPVITDATQAVDALKELVDEMERRYQQLANANAKQISGYHNMGFTDMPYIVVVIDEFADLMLSDKDVETYVVRLAQKARASGIHLILATQRPSVDVITGLIKANIGTRFGLTTTSSIDSKTIIDGSGCESLLGMGDGLYISNRNPNPSRFHAAFCPDNKIEQFIV